jgi:hypothetical protein
MVNLDRAERLNYYVPFWGLNGLTPDIAIEYGPWQPMSLDTDYDPGRWMPPPRMNPADAEWFRVLVAGPDATGNPPGTIVVTTSSRVFIRVSAGDEIDIKPDLGSEWIDVVASRDLI